MGFASRMAAASRISYLEGDSEKVAALKPYGLELVSVFSSSFAHAYLARGDVDGKHSLFFITRGTTKDWADIFTDIDARHHHPDKLDGEMVAHGYWFAALSIWWKVSHDIMAYPVRDIPVWFGGHSMGGAVSTDMAALSMRAGFNVAGLVTFGSPRVGGRSFARRMKKLPVSWRFVHEADAVPLLAPWWLDFVHLDGLGYLTRKSKCLWVPGFFEMNFDRVTSAVPRIGAGVSGGRASLMREPMLADHRISEYENALAKMETSSPV